MNTIDRSMTALCESPLSDATLVEADSKHVMDRVIDGTSLDPEIARRVEERGQMVRAEILQRLGVVRVAVDLIREGRDEE